MSNTYISNYKVGQKLRCTRAAVSFCFTVGSVYEVILHEGSKCVLMEDGRYGSRLGSSFVVEIDKKIYLGGE
ncbi:hypothetical protein KAU11_07335 [Candidatus Babeliales bacterium]|nr:hypothetical protein [Candidatus Babeliales bacterium]